MLNVIQFEDAIILPTLSKLQMYSKEAVELLKFTCAVESLGGTYIHQVKGPALGIFQMEPDTFTDIWHNYILNRSSLMSILGMNFQNPSPGDSDRLVYDLVFATAMARIHYRRFPEALPDHKDIEGLWEYYKKYWNTSKGKATKDKSIKLYEDFVKNKK